MNGIISKAASPPKKISFYLGFFHMGGGEFRSNPKVLKHFLCINIFEVLLDKMGQQSNFKSCDAFVLPILRVILKGLTKKCLKSFKSLDLQKSVLQVGGYFNLFWREKKVEAVFLVFVFGEAKSQSYL